LDFKLNPFYLLVGETFIANETVSQEIWGGSDTCQG